MSESRTNGAGDQPKAQVRPVGRADDRVRVDLGERGYDVTFVDDAGAAMAEALGAATAAASGARLGIISDANVHATWGMALEQELQATGWEGTTIVVAAGEESKSVAALTQTWDQLLSLPLRRNDVIVAFGGGVIGDLAGFAAATLLRGVRLVQIPTSLLAMVDSSVGGKTGINRPAGKNLVGAFHQPAAVLIDLAYLRTLDAAEYRAGLAEVVKYGAILDAEFLRMLNDQAEAIMTRDPHVMRKVVRRCVELKADVVRRDEREGGLRMILNFGHTIGHAIEAVAGYGTYRHGEAVAIGMAAVIDLAARLGRIDRSDWKPLIALLHRFELPTRLRAPLSADALLGAMSKDKKVGAAGVRFVLPVTPGKVEISADVPHDALMATLHAIGAE